MKKRRIYSLLQEKIWERLSVKKGQLILFPKDLGEYKGEDVQVR
jgi:hypothetical protein